MKKIKIIFCGTPEFAIPSFKSLLNDKNFEIIGVITQPDKKIGRQQIITAPPVKILAKQYQLPVWQPEKISMLDLKFLICDLIIVIAYAQIIPENILNLPKYGCINIHGSLLPKYRGASCIQAAIMNGDEKTGITVMKMNKGLDTGPIIAQYPITIENHDTGDSLYYKLSKLSGKIIVNSIKKYIDGKLIPKKQDETTASYVKLLKKEDGKIDWQKNATEIERFIRAMHSWPGAHSILWITDFLKYFLKIISVESNPIDINEYQPGTLFMHKDKLAVQCVKDSLIINLLQLEGKRIMSSEILLRGHKDFIRKLLK